jgi:hypothetical protein
MTTRNDWDRDPSVRAMRGLFSRMEAGQDDLLKEVGISSHDSRLRPCREEARDFFERVLSLSAARGRGQSEVDAAALYIHCLIRALKQHGLPVPAGAFQKDSPIEELFRESMK